MKGLVFITGVVLLVTWVPAQDQEPLPSPCIAPLIQKVSREGLESLRWRELPFFLREVYRCRHTPTGKATLNNLEQQWRTRSYESDHMMKGFSSTLAYFTTAILLVFYTNRLFSK